MKKIILLCFIVASIFADYRTDKYEKQERILKSIDVDPSYLNDESFMKIFYEMNTRDKLFIKRVLNKSKVHIPIIKAILKKEGVPDVFLYLAMVESNFKNHARSGAKAVGVWQFTESTAQSYGLKIDKYVDERKDVVASSLAAAKYLKKSRDRFEKWYLAIFAYNCGNYCVSKAITNANSKDLNILLNEKKKYLPAETRNYLKKILSTALISEIELEKSSDTHLLNQIMALNVQKVKLKPSENLAVVALKAGISYKEFKDLNPHFKTSYSPPYVYYAYLPIEKVSSYENFDKNIRKNLSNVKNIKAYKVKPGDTLYTIAKSAGTTTTVLKSLNNLKGDRIGINQTLLITVPEVSK